MTQLRQFLIPIVSTILLSACDNDDKEHVPDRLDRHSSSVELVLTEDGRPDPSVLAQEQVLHRDNGEEPATLDPHLARGVPSAHILRDLFEGLTAESPNGRVIPGAAIRWNISRDGKTYTFYLRREARWSNGDLVTAEDFVYGLRRSASPATASNYAQVLLPIANAAEVLSGALPVDQLGVTAINEYILQIKLKGPTPYFLGLLNHSSTYPVHRPSQMNYGSAFSRPGNLVSNGAYVLKDWVVRSRIELTRNENYWDADNVILERVIYHPFEDQSAASKQFRAGKLQWTYGVPNNQFKWLQKHYSDELVISPWLGSYFFGYNVTREPFIENPNLRLALALALDRDLLTEKVTQFGEQPSYTLVPPGIGEFVSPLPEWASWSQAERNEEARRLYAGAGYSEDKPLRFEIRYNTGENNKKMALAAASLWKQVLGVQATLVNEELKVFLQNREQKVLTQVFRAGWIGDYADPYGFLELFRTGHGRNDYGYSNELYDSLLEEIAAERIPARRRRLMFEAERILLAELPFIPVYTYVTKRLVSPRLRGWESNVMDHHYSKYMFLLKTVLEEQKSAAADMGDTVEAVEEAPAEETVTAEKNGETPEENEVVAEVDGGTREQHK
ncbi:MAG: ABC transporter substrate-binding protein [Gammaproteobacteria bacterium]|nr:MAG: ABC transporter substrate-binding protein [Gammaproteobacteria bacterium]